MSPTPILAVIPARGGSKGIIRKNALVVAGHSLLEWSILAARRATRVNRVVVSTDAPELAAIAEPAGAEVVWRPADLCGDRSSSEAALWHRVNTRGRASSTTRECLFIIKISRR